MTKDQANANAAKDVGAKTIASFVSPFKKQLHELSVNIPDLPM